MRLTTRMPTPDFILPNEESSEESSDESDDDALLDGELIDNNIEEPPELPEFIFGRLRKNEFGPP